MIVGIVWSSPEWCASNLGAAHPQSRKEKVPDGLAVPCDRDRVRGVRDAIPPHGGERPKGLYAAVAAGYAIAFVLLALTLAQGIGLAVAYGVWAAAGVALTAIASRVFFTESLTLVMTLGIGLVIVGVLLIETGTTHR